MEVWYEHGIVVWHEEFSKKYAMYIWKKKGVISIGIYNALCSAYQISLDHSFSG